MGATGTATLDFGAYPGSNEASVAVTGQGSIASGSAVEAFFMADVLGSHTANDHAYVAALAGLTCGNLVAGTGFTIYAKSTQQLTGQWTVHWVWN